MIILFISFIVFTLLGIAYVVFKKQKLTIDKRNKIISQKFQKYLELNINNISNLELAGVGEDGNSDYTFNQAVKEIILSNNIEVKI